LGLASEYRKLTTKEVQAPSGFKFTIRKVTRRALVYVMNMYPETLPTKGASMQELRTKLEETMTPQELSEFLDKTIPAVLKECIVKPKVGDKPSEDVLAVEEISGYDQLFLFFTILEFSGLTEEAFKELDFFRTKPSRKTSG